MDEMDLYSIVCGLLAMLLTACVAMVLGYQGMSFSAPWPGLLMLGVGVEVVLMRMVGPLPGLLVMALLSPLEKRLPQLGKLMYVFIPVTALGLAFLLLQGVCTLGNKIHGH